MKEHSFFEKEDRCRRVFEWTIRKFGGVWHLCTPGEKQPLIFKRPEDYAFAMTLVAMCAFDCPNVQVITFEIMSNHVHFVLCGSQSDVMAFFNNFVVDPGHTPFSYPYGANSCYFMPMIRERKHVLFGELTLREKRNLIHAREPSYPKDYIITDGYFSPVNYCRFDIGEAIFRDARHYFFLLGKNVESYRDIAKEIGDSIYYTDDDGNDKTFDYSPFA